MGSAIKRYDAANLAALWEFGIQPKTSEDGDFVRFSDYIEGIKNLEQKCFQLNELRLINAVQLKELREALDRARGRYHKFEIANCDFPDFCRICGHHKDDQYVNHGDMET